MNNLEALSLDDCKLVVGIDFGTTFSGIAWAETRRHDHQSVIETWPASLETQDGVSSVKAPTEIRYTPQGMEWGFQIPAVVERHRCFKLGLAGGSRALSGPAGLQKSAEDLTVDYLTALCKHLMYTLEQKLGASILRTIPLEFCITVPAFWSEVAKQKTLTACQKAGLDSKLETLLVSEPEAAAIYALHGLDPHGLKIGESFVLCDAGGGTVDLISYTIVELYPILRVKEAAEGTGGLCGSTFLNKRFGDFLISKLGREPGWDEEILAEAMERFESVIKKQYSPSQKSYSILVPGLANNDRLGIRRNRFTIKPEDMESIFEPIVGNVIELVTGQIKATNEKIRAVLLVGGFGQNNYLKERLRRSFGPLIDILQPPNAWTAVVRGAVMMGLAHANKKLTFVSLESRAARKHYGIGLNLPFNADIHDLSKRYWSDVDNLWRVPGIRWLIKKGDPVEENKPILINFRYEHPLSGHKPRKFQIRICCDENSAIAPIHRNSNCRDLATLQPDLSHLQECELSQTIKRVPGGKDYYSIGCIVEATFYSASTKYVLNILGKRYDTVTAEYV